jgi:pyridoxine 5-phosphate synthase
MTQLSINLNKIALIRNARDTEHPDPCEFAASVIQAGAHGITVHPRPDQRHIRAEDCVRLATIGGTELNIEGNPFAATQRAPRAGIGDYPGFLALIERIRPEQVTLVPDGDDQLTSDHGFDITRDGDRLLPVVEQLKGWGCRVSLFMDPDPAQISLVRALGADRVELYTESYARAHERGDFGSSLTQFQEAAAEATLHGLGINAGHDLNLSNLPDFHIDALLEVSIGHAFTIDALRYGVTDAIARYLQALDTVGRF